VGINQAKAASIATASAAIVHRGIARRGKRKCGISE
jgi:hypothetical protein